MLEVDSSVNGELSVVLDGHCCRSKAVSLSGHLEGTLLSHVDSSTAGQLFRLFTTIILIGKQDCGLGGNGRVINRHLVGLHVAVVHLGDVNDGTGQRNHGSVNLLSRVLRLGRAGSCPCIQCTGSSGDIAVGALCSLLLATLGGLQVQDLTVLEVDVVCALLLIDLNERDGGLVGKVALGLHLHLHLVDGGDGVVAAKEHVDTLCPDAAVLRNFVCAFSHGVAGKGLHHVRSGALLGVDGHSNVVPHALLEGHRVLLITIEIVVEDIVAVVVAILPVGVGRNAVCLRIGTLQLCDGEQAQRVVAGILAVVDAGSDLPSLGNHFGGDDRRSDQGHLGRELCVLGVAGAGGVGLNTPLEPDGVLLHALVAVDGCTLFLTVVEVHDSVTVVVVAE